MNHFLLHLLVREMASEVHGRKIRSIRLLHPLVSIELAARSNRRYLVVLLSTPGPYCYYGREDPLEAAGPAVLRRVYDARVAAPPVPPSDRVIRLVIDRAGDASTLAISLFGSSAKVRVQTAEHVVESLDASEAGMALRGSARSTPPPFATADPSSVGSSPAGDVSRVASGLEPVMAECFTAGDGTIDSTALFRFRDDMLAGAIPFALAGRGRLGRVAPVPANARLSVEPEHRYGPFDSVIAACETVGEVLARGAREAILARYRGALNRHVTKRRRLLKNLEGDLRKARESDAGRQEADILAAYRSQIPPGARKIELPDLYAKDKTRVIELDPSLPIGAQIQNRYKRAAKLERSRDALRERIRAVRGGISEITETLVRADAEGFHAAIERLHEGARRFRVFRQDRRSQREGVSVKQYRRMDLDDHWFVLVGRNDQENDEITFRLSNPDDFWLHAQQVAGSHVVLRSSGKMANPPAAILETAAAIAAFYSKARHSRLVPVIYTRRKYVRKFRGAKPGQVTCEREKTIFVEPKLS
jgi:predicted ribosome quality control (RQC) complex YloA/Tae2 family protein